MPKEIVSKIHFCLLQHFRPTKRLIAVVFVRSPILSTIMVDTYDMFVK